MLLTYCTKISLFINTALKHIYKFALSWHVFTH